MRAPSWRAASGSRTSTPFRADPTRPKHCSRSCWGCAMNWGSWPRSTTRRRSDTSATSRRASPTWLSCRPRTCWRERQDFCTTGAFTERGIKQAHGYLTERVIEDEHNLVAVPPQLTDVAVLVEPLSLPPRPPNRLKPSSNGCPGSWRRPASWFWVPDPSACSLRSRGP